MERWAEVFPQYGLERNKGYGTPEHLDGLRRFGPSALHRFSYEPVRAACPPDCLPAGIQATQQTLFAGMGAS